MFDGLEKAAKVNPEILPSLAHRAARLFIEDQIPMNTTIFKMAQEHGLNEEFIKRVCEKANNSVDAAYFDQFQKTARRQSGDDKIFYPKFAAADFKVVTAALGKSEKTASVHIHLDDYDKSPPLELTTRYNRELEIEFVKEASQKDPVPERAGLALEKLTAVREEVMFRKLAMDLKLDDCAHDLYHKIKQHVLNGSDLKNIYKATLSKHSKEEDRIRVKDLFQHAARKLVDEGVVITQDRQAVKLAYSPLDRDQMDSYVSDMFEMPTGSGEMMILNGSYVNDDHPLFSELDILVRQYDEADRYDKALTVIDDRIKYVKHKIRGETIGGA